MPIILLGDEFGPYSTTSELRVIARQYARDNFIGDTIQNQQTGQVIKITMVGVKHTIHNAWDDLLKTVMVIPAILEQGTLTSSLLDGAGRPITIHKYQHEVAVAGKILQIIATVREMNNGDINYYDHAIVKV